MRLGHVFRRGVAGFLGAFGLLNVLVGLVLLHFNANLWWLDLRPMPAPLGHCLLGTGAAALLAVAANALLSPRHRRIVAGAVLVLALLALRDSMHFYLLTFRGTIRPAVLVPLSLPLSLLLLWIAWHAVTPTDGPQSRHARRREAAFSLGVALAAMVGVPLLAMVFFGTTDYRRPADVAVVFGARAYGDGRPSDALADRVRTACDLYHEGLVNRLLFSGGPGDGPVHETESMRRLAVQLGVPESAILLDAAGLNTEATVRNTRDILGAPGSTRVLAVSHGYHLPRIKLCYQRRAWEVYTVPARQTRPLRAMPLLMAREVAAAWAYYLAPLLARAA